jgi:hypothetical protein
MEDVEMRELLEGVAAAGSWAVWICRTRANRVSKALPASGSRERGEVAYRACGETAEGPSSGSNY